MQSTVKKKTYHVLTSFHEHQRKNDIMQSKTENYSQIDTQNVPKSMIIETPANSFLA